MDEQVLNRFKESVKKEYNWILKYTEDEKEKDLITGLIAELKYTEFLEYKEQIDIMKSKKRMGFMDRLCARLFSKEK